jgi:hypothetical protein
MAGPDIVVVARYNSLMEFDQAKAALEAEGITVLPDSESTVGANPWYAGAIGGIRLKVHAANAARARELLATPFPPLDEAVFEAKRRRAKRVFCISAAIGAAAGLGVGLHHQSWVAGVQVGAMTALVAYLMLGYGFVAGR